MGVAFKKVREYFSNLEEGNWVVALLVLAGLALGGIVDVWLDLRVTPVLLVLLFGALARNTLQKSRPRDSLSRVTGWLRTRSVVSHPRFSGAVTTGLRSLGKRLWTPRWIVGALDFTNDGLRWDPLEGHANFGFNSFFVAWTEIQSAVLKWHLRYYNMDTGNMILRGTFGPPINVRIDQFDKSKHYFEAHGIPIVKRSAASGTG